MRIALILSRCYALPLVDALKHNHKGEIHVEVMIGCQGRRESRSSRMQGCRGSRSSRFKVVEDACVVSGATLQTNGESEIVKVYP